MVDASVARSFAVVGWTPHLVALSGGCIRVAEGVHGMPDDLSELRGIRDALSRQADQSGLWSGRASRALAAVTGLDELLGLDKGKLTILHPDEDEKALVVRLQSVQPEQRAWRQGLGARSRRLDVGEAVTIAIAHLRSLDFASDDSDALALWKALTKSPGLRTVDLFRRLVDRGDVADSDARSAYQMLQADELHTLGGPDW